jgi:hypothetical protein
MLSRILAKPPWVTVVALSAAPVAYMSHPRAIDLLLRPGSLADREIDFTNYWMASRLLFAHKSTILFDQTRYSQALESVGINHSSAPFTFSYPPSVLPLISWVGVLPYPAALALWSLMGLAALFAAAWPHSKNPWVAVAILVSPAVFASLHFGQNGLFTGAVVLAALKWLDRRPILAGILIGLLCAKPQLAILLPIALLAARRWRIIAAAAASAATLIATSLILAGTESWHLYLTSTVPLQGFLYHQNHSLWQAMTASPAIETVTAGGSWSTAFAVQTVATFAMVALVAAIFAARQRGPITELDKIVLLSATFLATPYSFEYDMGALAVCLLVASVTNPDLDRFASWRYGILLLWSAPIAMVVVGRFFLSRGQPWPPIGALMLAAGVFLVVWTSYKKALSPVGSPIRSERSPVC